MKIKIFTPQFSCEDYCGYVIDSKLIERGCVEIDAEIYSDFEYYLSACMTENNGSLEEIAPDWMINRLRRSVANDISCADISYEQALDVLQKYNVFGTWTVYEINNRPVNVDELAEIIEQETED